MKHRLESDFHEVEHRLKSSLRGSMIDAKTNNANIQSLKVFCLRNGVVFEADRDTKSVVLNRKYSCPPRTFSNVCRHFLLS